MRYKRATFISIGVAIVFLSQQVGWSCPEIFHFLRPTAVAQRRFSLQDLDNILQSYETLKRAAEDGSLEVLIPEWKKVKDQTPIQVVQPVDSKRHAHELSVGQHILEVTKDFEVLIRRFCPGIDLVRARRISLLHDIAKRGYEIFEGDHAVYSAKLAREIMNRLGYNAAVVDVDCKVILYHNALDWLMRQADFPPYLDLNEFAEFLTLENIDLLYALKLADIAGKRKRSTTEFWKDFEKTEVSYVITIDDLGRIIKTTDDAAKRVEAIKKTFFQPARLGFPDPPWSLDEIVKGKVTLSNIHQIKLAPDSSTVVRAREIIFTSGKDEIAVAGERAVTGRAIILNPAEVTTTFWTSIPAMRYDYSQFALSEEKARELTRQKGRPIGVKRRPGKTLADIVQEQNDGTLIAATNCSQQNWMLANGFLIAGDGALITKPEPNCGVLQDRWEPLDGTFTVFSFDPNSAGMKTVALENGNLVKGNTVRLAVAGAPLLVDGKIVIPQESKTKKGKLVCPKNDQIFFDPISVNAAFSAVGIIEDGMDKGKIVLLHMCGKPGKEIFVGELAYCMAKLGCRSAVLMGGSADVQQWTVGDGKTPAIIAKERVKLTARTDTDVRPLGQAILIWHKGKTVPSLLIQHDPDLRDMRHSKEQTLAAI